MHNTQPTWQHNITLYCKRTKTTTYIKTSYEEHITHCTCCKPTLPLNANHVNHVRVTPMSELDEFALTYNLHPVVAATLCKQNETYNMRLYATPKLRLTLSDYVERVLSVSPQSITPLYVHCNACGSSFTVLRSDPTTFKSPPTHCIYCASTNIGLQQADTNDTAFLSLAHHYGLPLATIKALYDFWQHRPNHPTFYGFMHSPNMQPVINTLTQIQA